MTSHTFKDNNLHVCISAIVQSYATNVYGEDVMIGNDVLLKCAIPSFLADLLSVAGWVGSEGAQISANQNYHLGNFCRTLYICSRVRL